MGEAPQPPRASPSVPGVASQDDDQEPTTGVHPATRDFVREVNKSGLFKVSWAMLLWIGLIATGSVTGYRAAAQTATDAGVQAVEPISKRVAIVEQQIPQLRDEVYEARKDVRALQDVLLTRRRSERLDEPLAAPTPFDGGRR